MKNLAFTLLLMGMVLLPGCKSKDQKALNTELASLKSCGEMIADGFRPIAATLDMRFLGKVQEGTAICRGGDRAKNLMTLPWVDWGNYWATGDLNSMAREIVKPPDLLNNRPIGKALRALAHLGPNGRGIDGALLDLEYQRIELIKFNLFDNNMTYEQFIKGRDGVGGAALKTWREMRLPIIHPNYRGVGGGAKQQVCTGDLIRFRTVTGICNDMFNPLMGSSETPFARNVEFDTTFPDLGLNQLTRNRHGSRLGLLKPDPQVISRKLFTRAQSRPEACNDGYGVAGNSKDGNCDYKKAPFFNVLAAFWIQFMTHDWFSHLDEGHNAPEYMKVGCAAQLVNGVEKPLTPEEIQKLGCRPGDEIDKAYIADSSAPSKFTFNGKDYLTRAPRTTLNMNTGWWDASQIYGYSDLSRRRMKRNPNDHAKMMLVSVGARPGNGEKLGYLPVFQPGDPINPAWTGQEAAAFPDNWTVGMSFFHNLFAREHNTFVDEFRKQAANTPDADSGLRNPSKPDYVIRYRDVTPDELFEVTRLVIAAEIAKIHTIEWTTQLLYDEPLYRGMNANWNGLLGVSNKPEVEALRQVLENITTQNFGKSQSVKKATQWYSVFASGPGIFGLGSHIYADDPVFAAFDPNKKDLWDIRNPAHVNGGVNHFGSPFNFPEEFISVYRLHSLAPDLIEYREWNSDANKIQSMAPVVETFRGKATDAMRSRGLANWALSMGRQRLGLLTLHNIPRFMQNLKMERLHTATGQIDVAALDLIRDRERGVPRFNEFRRQYGLRQLTSFDDFVDKTLPAGSPERLEQEDIAKTLREVYGQHVCDASKVITDAQVDENNKSITDCLRYPNGAMVDNVEDVDLMVGFLAEPRRPHGFAISETQFVVFILNASRRLYSDRFLTSSFRPELYTTFGLNWINNNGPMAIMETAKGTNGHQQPVSPLKRVLSRAMPELEPELKHVVNAFDPWARDRGEYYSLEWKPRPGAESDPAFTP